jgi:ubiquinone/menaquinone biosynthesis C-methylase UbiE
LIRARSNPIASRLRRWAALGSIVLCSPIHARTAEAAPVVSADVQSAAPAPVYQWRQIHDPDGIGKFYRGREIAQVMGHQGAEWLERAERESEERPSLLLKILKVQPGQAAADVGAGTGYLSIPLAGLVGAKGRVYAVDVQQEMLDMLSSKLVEQNVTNVIPVLGAITNTALPAEAIDLVLLVDVYHEFSHPREMMSSICRSLKPGGRVVFVEYRGEDPAVPIKPLHKMTEAQVRKEMADQPLEWVETNSELPRQHVIVFKKRR